MGNKPIFLALLLLTILIRFIAAQEKGEDKTYSYVVLENGGAKILQRLFWTAEPYVRQYEIIIEQKNAGESYTEMLREFTKETFIDVSLGPGNYRYTLQVYDLLNRPQGTAEWEYFEIMLALKPGIQDFSPAAFYLDEDTSWNIIITGLNLVQGAEVLLRQTDRHKDIVPQTTVIDSAGRTVRIGFAMSSLVTGNFTLAIKNPGGLDTEAGNFRVAFRKPVDFNVSAGYGPVIPLYGNFFSFFEQDVFPLGAHTRLSLVPFKRVWGYLGVELDPFWNYMEAKNPSEGYSVSSQVTGVDVKLLYQKWLPNRTMAFNLRLGTGVTSISDFHFSYSGGNSQSFTGIYFSAGAEASFQWLIRKPFFVEAGLGFNHIFAINDQIQPGFIRPLISAGWQF
ncbi:hypothetical protein [Treponema primitia]|uniref:hypothetical protein n=1 Tax=Treponema primitia TaxID=88058 RepID=UPI0002554FD8|nr:hypothetical protein [Treponema primitia]